MLKILLKQVIFHITKIVWRLFDNIFYSVHLQIINQTNIFLIQTVQPVNWHLITKRSIFSCSRLQQKKLNLNMVAIDFCWRSFPTGNNLEPVPEKVVAVISGCKLMQNAEHYEQRRRIAAIRWINQSVGRSVGVEWKSETKEKDAKRVWDERLDERSGEKQQSRWEVSCRISLVDECSIQVPLAHHVIADDQTDGRAVTVTDRTFQRIVDIVSKNRQILSEPADRHTTQTN